MAWVPSTRFEDDLVDMEPGFNLIHGQLDYEERRKKEFIPRPKNTYEYLSAREKRNAELESRSPEGEKAREIRQSLELMERIQRIAGTKPLGEHATMADLEDTSTVELEAVAMMRHFGMMSMAGVPLSVKSFYEEKHAGEMPVQGSVQVSRNGHRTFPLIMDPNYFTPRKTRRPQTTSFDGNDTTSSYHTAESWTSCNSVYESAKSDLESSISSAEVPKKSEKYIEIPYQLLEESLEEEEEKPPAIQEKSKGKRKGRRPNQKERQMSHKKQQYQL
ncbi:uncharacterized protein squ isoform X1 [Drosophila kikkawai]|uniref:Uncharacterized protein squ isoform X1 n=1 Tax=Drosophila kikkawai TaxID=30033 RepID=A0A6P4I9L6_DROKI|nr:uncharacterized protein LOC108072566 isoform X1 [Drosophila kikkawai]